MLLLLKKAEVDGKGYGVMRRLGAIGQIIDLELLFLGLVINFWIQEKVVTVVYKVVSQLRGCPFTSQTKGLGHIIILG